jgi:hypothetical protein
MISLLLFTACSPQDATITDGQMFSWLALNSSKVFIDESLPFLEDLADNDQYADDLAVSMYECSGREVDEDGYLAAQDNFPHTTGDACADIDTISFENHKFIQNDGFYLLQQPISPWRTEALINGEGHLQLTAHQALPNGEDFRFNFVINPNFSPITCTTNDAGLPQVEWVDGSDWVYQWSLEEEGHQIYYLNAGAYQINPSDTDDYWFLTTDWNSGFGHSKFSSEDFYATPTNYGNYDEDGGGDDFMFIENRNAPDYDAYDNAVTELATTAETWGTELAMFAGANVDGTPAFSHKVESNTWRPINNSNAGLDGWAETHSSWVRLSNDSDITDGGMAKGDFQILYTADESNSQILVKGSFVIPELKVDAWAYPMLEDDKREEYETEFCGGATLGE